MLKFVLVHAGGHLAKTRALPKPLACNCRGHALRVLLEDRSPACVHWTVDPKAFTLSENNDSKQQMPW